MKGTLIASLLLHTIQSREGVEGGSDRGDRSGGNGGGSIAYGVTAPSSLIIDTKASSKLNASVQNKSPLAT